MKGVERISFYLVTNSKDYTEGHHDHYGYVRTPDNHLSDLALRLEPSATYRLVLSS